MRELGAKLGLWELVWLHDFHGEMNLRIARSGGPTGLRAIRMGPWFWPTRWVYLKPNGELMNGSYVTRWSWAKGASDAKGEK